VRVTLEPVQTREYSPIREEVFNMLRDAILSGKLRPGDRLVERELAEQLGVSRTPVREALRKLELENLVTHIPRRGVVVSEISRNDVIEIFNIRSCLEGLAANMAAQKISDDNVDHLRKCVEEMEIAAANGNREELNGLHNHFNQKILDIAGSPRLTQMINSLSDYISRFTKTGYAIPGRPSAANKEHEELVDALAEGNSQRAEEIAELHIKNSMSVVLRQYEKAKIASES